MIDETTAVLLAALGGLAAGGVHVLTGPDHLAAAGAPCDTPVAATKDKAEFTRVFLGNARSLDMAEAREDVVDAARRLVRANPDVGAIVLECTNMTPYAADIAAAVARPVFTIETFVRWFHAGLAPQRFGGGGGAAG